MVNNVNFFRVVGVILGILTIISGADICNYGTKLTGNLGVVLILMGVFQFCFAFILAKMYEEVKDIKANTLFSLSYIESLLVCIKNKMEKNKNSDEE